MLKRLEPGGDMASVDGTKVPKEQWYNPPAGILPRQLTEEEVEAERARNRELLELQDKQPELFEKFKARQ